MTSKYWYYYGGKTYEQALERLEEFFALGDISPGEKPRIESYRTRAGVCRYGIILNQ